MLFKLKYDIYDKISIAKYMTDKKVKIRFIIQSQWHLYLINCGSYLEEGVIILVYWPFLYFPIDKITTFRYYNQILVYLNLNFELEIKDAP